MHAISIAARDHRICAGGKRSIAGRGGALAERGGYQASMGYYQKTAMTWLGEGDPVHRNERTDAHLAKRWGWRTRNRVALVGQT